MCPALSKALSLNLLGNWKGNQDYVVPVSCKLVGRARPAQVKWSTDQATPAKIQESSRWYHFTCDRRSDKRLKAGRFLGRGHSKVRLCVVFCSVWFDFEQLFVSFLLAAETHRLKSTEFQEGKLGQTKAKWHSSLNSAAVDKENWKNLEKQLGSQATFFLTFWPLPGCYSCYPC